MDKLITPEIRAFLEKLLDDKGIKADGPVREQMISDLFDRLEVRFYQLVVENLSVSELDTLGGLADKGQDEVQSFLRENVKNIDVLFAEAMEEFRSAYLEG